MTDSSQQILGDLRAAQIFAHLDEAQLTRLAGVARLLELPAEIYQDFIQILQLLPFKRIR